MKKAKYEGIGFYRTAVDNRLLKHKILNNPNLYQIFKKNQDITEEINQEIRYRTLGSQENFITIFITGEQSKKKSSTAQSIAEDNDTTLFNIDRITFRYEEYKDKLATSLAGCWFIIDEQAFKHGIGSQRLIHEIIGIIEQLRQRRNSLIICSPSLKYFDENLFTFILELIDDKIIVTCPHQKYPHETRNCPCYYENNYQVLHAETRSLVKRNGNYIGFYITKIKWNSPLWQQYQQIKKPHVEEVATGTTQQSPYQKIAEEIIQQPENQIYLTKKKRIKLLLTETFPNFTTEEIQLSLEAILVEIEKKQNEALKNPPPNLNKEEKTRY